MAGAAALAVTAAGVLVAGVVNAATSTFASSPSIGSDVRAIAALKNGTYDVAGNPDEPIHRFNAVVVGLGTRPPNTGTG